MPLMPTVMPNRRVLLKLMAATSLAGCGPRADGGKKRVAVIGGGIVGASIAYHLAQAGASVTILERGRLAERSSRGTFAWINASWAKQPKHYHALSQAGVSGWKRLQATLSLPVRWGGSLEWFPTTPRQARLAEQIAEQAQWGEPAEMVGRDQLATMEPNVDFGGTAQAAFSGNDGAVDPVPITKALVDAAVRLGAVLRQNCSVEGVKTSSGAQVTLETSSGPVAVDDFVLATGADEKAPLRLAGIDIPQRTTPGVIVVTAPVPRLINRIIVAPGVHIHQRDDGRIVLGEQDGAPDTQDHEMRLRGRPNRFPDPRFADQHAQRILEIAEKYVHGINKAPVEDVFIGWRHLPVDGHPVLGRSPNQPSAYLAIMHSGVTLAPVVGALVAREITSGVTALNIAEYRPGRDFSHLARY